METYRSDIVIEIRLHDNNHVTSKLLLQAFDSLETALFASDRRDVELAASELDIPKIIRDASLERLRQHRNNRLLLTEARTGSIELFALVAGVAYYVLDKTIGESFKGGYVDSNVHEKLKEFFRRQIDEKALFIVENIRRTFGSKKQEVIVKLLPPSANGPNQIIIDISENIRIARGERVGSLGEELDKRS